MICMGLPWVKCSRCKKDRNNPLQAGTLCDNCRRMDRVIVAAAKVDELRKNPDWAKLDAFLDDWYRVYF